MEGARKSVDELLELIVHRGWTEALAQRFEDEYGPMIKRTIVLHLWRLGIVSRHFSPNSLRALPTRELELFENTLSDVWIAILGGLVSRYLREEKSGRINRPFTAYLSGTIKKILITNAQRLGLLPRKSEAEMLLALSSAKKFETQQKYVALLKFHFEGKVRELILTCCPPDQFQQVYDHLSQLSAYFFEKYLVQACCASRNKCKKIPDLVALFMRSDYIEGLLYVGHVVPYADSGLTKCYPPQDISIDEFLSLLSLRRTGA